MAGTTASQKAFASAILKSRQGSSKRKKKKKKRKSTGGRGY